MKKEKELLQNFQPKTIYKQFSDSVNGTFNFITKFPKLPKSYALFSVEIAAFRVTKANIYGMAIKFNTYTDGKGTNEILFVNGAETVSLNTVEDVISSIAKMKKKFKYKEMTFTVQHEKKLLELMEK